MGELLYTELFSSRKDNRVFESDAGGDKETEFSLLDTGDDFGDFNLDLSVIGNADSGLIQSDDNEEFKLELAEVDKLEGVTGYLRKILEDMQSLERWMYFREVERYEKPADIIRMIGILIDMRGRLVTIPKNFRNSIYLCVYTKFADMGERFALDRDDYYHVYYNHVIEIEDAGVFLYGLEQDVITYFDMLNVSDDTRRQLKRDLRVLLFNLRKVS